jgi:FkbM family methyltransferase
MLSKFLKPKQLYDLIRLGRNNDGGYLVETNSLKVSKALISFGLSFDWSFEKDFYNFHSKEPIPIHCYDYTVKYSAIKKLSRRSLINIFNINYYSLLGFKKIINNFFLSKDYKNFFTNNRIHFRSAIGIGTNLVSIDEVFDRIATDHIFLKIDIEGSEYRILNDILRVQEKLSGLVIEFHNIDLHMEVILNFINNLSYLKIVHIHGQNPGGKDYLDSKGDPIQIEVTFSSTKNYLDTQAQIPHPLDQVSDPRFEEVKLNFTS